MRWAGVVLFGLITACSSPTAGQVHTTTAPASSTRTASPSSLSSAEPVADVGFTCQLPVGTQAGTLGGFVRFPGGDFSADPNGVFIRNQSDPFQWTSTKQPHLIGSSATLFYDRALSRWLPSSQAAVNSDGTRYAYVIGWSNPTVHIVDVATGRERVFSVRRPLGAGVFAFTKAGVYLAGMSEASDPGVWLVDPQKGSERLLTNEVIVVAVGNGKAWLGQLTNSRVGSTIDTLVELDLASGSKKVWVHRDKPNVNLIGLTSDWLPVVEMTGEGVSLFRSPGVGEKIYSGDHRLASVVSDTHGIWFGSYDGIYLYSSGFGLHRVSTVSGSPTGPCI
jgi:hypothetical protein